MKPSTRPHPKTPFANFSCHGKEISHLRFRLLRGFGTGCLLFTALRAAGCGRHSTLLRLYIRAIRSISWSRRRRRSTCCRWRRRCRSSRGHITPSETQRVSGFANNTRDHCPTTEQFILVLDSRKLASWNGIGSSSPDIVLLNCATVIDSEQGLGRSIEDVGFD